MSIILLFILNRYACVEVDNLLYRLAIVVTVNSKRWGTH